jgi:SulP family sulfate permease
MSAFKLVSVRDFIPRTCELFGGKGRYGLAALGKDLVAGVTVGVVALPLSMAFSIAAGAAPAQGLYTAVFAGFCISLFGGSRFQIGGPTGAFVVIIFGIVMRHGMPGLILATILAGLMLIAMGLTGLGRFVKYIPYPVTTGFTAGIGLLIFSQQIKDFFGLPIAESSPEFVQMWRNNIRALPLLNQPALATAFCTLVVMLLVRRFVPRIPAAAAGVAAATTLCWALKLPVETIGSRFGGIPQSLPAFSLPSFNWEMLRQVLPDSFTIALLAAIESLLSAVVADGMTGDRHKANMELAAQGLGNIVSALAGGIPATGAIARTAANIKSGAVTPVAGMLHAVTLLLFIMFLAPLASAIPLASLSAVLMLVAWDMSSAGRFARLLFKAPRSDAAVLLVTFMLTVLVDLTFAVEIGVMSAVFLFLKRMIEVTGVKPGAEDIGSRLLFATAGGEEAAPGSPVSQRIPEHASAIEIYEITGPFFFGVADTLQHVLRGVAKKPRAIILRMRAVPAVDSTGVTALESFFHQCRHGKIALFVCELQEQPRKTLDKLGFLDALGRDNVRDTLPEAILIAGDL